MTYHTKKPKYNIEYLGLREEILSKFYADNSFQETNDPVRQNKRLDTNSSYQSIMHYQKYA